MNWNWKRKCSRYIMCCYFQVNTYVIEYHCGHKIPICNSRIAGNCAKGGGREGGGGEQG